MTPLARLEEVTVRHGGHVVTLRPTLRAAMTLERLYNGWSGFLLHFDQFHLNTVQTLIRASAVSHVAAEALLSSLEGKPLKQIKATLEGPCVALLSRFLNPTGDDEGQGAETPKKTGKALSWSDAYAELYQIGTGWLGWTPQETWAATPTEITEAFKGKLAMLKAIHGSAEEDPAPQANDYTPERLKEIEELGHDPAFDRNKLHGLKARLNA
ncbi:hypothetical protein [Celeribacter neptunius]|uniref:Phage tail assembly chaperone protein, TAC n=1 Tax=Celeribacter neptunius TaxID=588602 RepID=A0A1I3LI31_9RHOB|nr:hypothetical protein [Celeribacter neptunius]SFI84408.1 hypothetical protein SAMN04487991_1040 [Celeribacter neptunius]